MHPPHAVSKRQLWALRLVTSSFPYSAPFLGLWVYQMDFDDFSVRQKARLKTCALDIGVLPF
jgi:hypothetical protein